MLVEAEIRRHARLCVCSLRQSQRSGRGTPDLEGPFGPIEGEKQDARTSSDEVIVSEPQQPSSSAGRDQGRTPADLESERQRGSGASSLRAQRVPERSESLLGAKLLCREARGRPVDQAPRLPAPRPEPLLYSNATRGPRFRDELLGGDDVASGREGSETHVTPKFLRDYN